MGLRCELCDDFLPIFQFSKLCEKCYRIRTLVKVYGKDDICSHLEDKFMVSHTREEEEKRKDAEYFKREEVRLNQELIQELNKLETIVEEKEKTEYKIDVGGNQVEVPLKDQQSDVADKDLKLKNVEIPKEVINEYNTRSKLK